MSVRDKRVTQLLKVSPLTVRSISFKAPDISVTREISQGKEKA